MAIHKTAAMPQTLLERPAGDGGPSGVEAALECAPAKERERASPMASAGQCTEETSAAITTGRAVPEAIREKNRAWRPKAQMARRRPPSTSIRSTR